jgi:hypothetical protein
MTANAAPYRGIYVGAVTGTLAAVLTMDVRHVSMISDQWLVGSIQRVLMIFILPGLIAAAGVAGNSHAFSLIVSAVINGVIYFTVGWLLYFVVARTKRQRKGQKEI